MPAFFRKVPTFFNWPMYAVSRAAISSRRTRVGKTQNSSAARSFPMRTRIVKSRPFTPPCGVTN
jgi:hypothetical protein